MRNLAAKAFLGVLLIGLLPASAFAERRGRDYHSYRGHSSFNFSFGFGGAYFGGYRGYYAPRSYFYYDAPRYCYPSYSYCPDDYYYTPRYCPPPARYYDDYYSSPRYRESYYYSRSHYYDP